MKSLQEKLNKIKEQISKNGTLILEDLEIEPICIQDEGQGNKAVIEKMSNQDFTVTVFFMGEKLFSKELPYEDKELSEEVIDKMLEVATL